MKEDPNYIAKLEKAIKDKYGDEAIKNPKSFWTKDKEEKYLEQLKRLNRAKEEGPDKEELDGFFVSKKLLNKKEERSCPVCNVYSFSSSDGVYMSKFGCCFECYVKYVERREDRWFTGWRPKIDTNDK